MNKKNLKNLLKWAETNIPKEQFDMEVFREGQEQTPQCDSVGCMVGWATGAFVEDFKDDTYKDFLGDISFIRWSMNKFDLSINSGSFCSVHSGQR